MPKRIPLGAIGVTRNGKTVYPTIGEVFDFTSDEVAELNALEKSSKTQLIRKPIVEGAADDQGNGGAPVAKELSAMNLEELKVEAARRNIELGEAKTKAEIRALIEAAIEAEDL